MDKYEYNLKLEEIDKLVDQGDYQEAANLADTIDWKRVRNIRTLSLISEIYEASGRLEESKALLLRAYRRSPVGRTILYRLVEVLTALGQYDEAIEYYAEYVQAAPHDNNRYILKYKIYKGRGSQIEELIAILEEYLGQEYTERWAYELATLYQQSGQMQKCLAACDDLVLWFHSGKYVMKALELKKRYASLTPKQQQIYEAERQESRMQEQEKAEEPVEEENIIRNTVESTDGEVIAETIMAETEKEIADQVSARKAEMEKAAGEAAPEEVPEVEKTKIFGTAPGEEPERAQPRTGGAASEGKAVQTGNAVPDEPENLQVELAKSMRKIISGVVKRNDPSEDDIPASMDARLQSVQRIQMPQVEEQVAGQLSIDDILLSMSDKGKRVTDVVLGEAEEPQKDAEKAAGAKPVETASRERTQARAGEQQTEADARTGSGEPWEEAAARTESGELATEAAAGTGSGEPWEEAAARTGSDEPLTEADAHTGSDEPWEEADARTESGEPWEEADVRTESGEPWEETDARTGSDRLRTGREARISGRERYGRSVTEAATEELTDIQREALQYTNNPGKLLKNKRSLPTYMSEEQVRGGADTADDLGKTRRIASREELMEAAKQDILSEKTIRIPTEQIRERLARNTGDQELTLDREGFVEAKEAGTAAQEYDDAQVPEEELEMYDDVQELTDEDYGSGEQEMEDDYYLTIPEHLRGLFAGFTEVEGLEDQIANAIIQAEAKGDDRTSRSGNILIFGAHGSGKTTLAMNIAKAIARDRQNQVMKMAKIYAADLNRKDIAATVAKIAGGALIIEEAGDLEPGTVEQLTTAMEFRTDGLIVILEDEQEYVHELLMRHPRFTMKFTAQIYLPDYTVDELANFGQIYAGTQDYVIGDDAWEVFCQKIEDAFEGENPVTISHVIEIVQKAVSRSNKFFRKISMGKKRYDESDYVVLFPKDFK